MWISVSSCCEEQADKRREKSLRKQNNASPSVEKHAKKRQPSKTPRLNPKTVSTVSWIHSKFNQSHQILTSSETALCLITLKFAFENCMTSEWPASPAEESKRTIWKLFLIWSVTFPHDLDTGPLSFRWQDLLRLCLPFVGAEVGARLQRLMLLSFGERAPLIGRLISGRVVWIVTPTIFFQVPQYELPQCFNCGGMKTTKWKKIRPVTVKRLYKLTPR